MVKEQFKCHYKADNKWLVQQLGQYQGYIVHHLQTKNLHIYI